MNDEPAEPTERVPRSAEEAARRVLALLVVVGRVHDPERCVAWMKKHDLEPVLSPAELAFVRQEAPTEEARVAFSWRAEAMVSLLWALNALPEMPAFNEQFDVFEVEMVGAALKDPHAFVSAARLRSAEEIGEMEHRLYHQHWRVRDAQFGGFAKLLEPDPDDPPIEDLHPGIVYERRYALSWLAGWGDDWDHVPTDT